MALPDFTTYKETNKDSNEDSVLGDMIRHCNKWRQYSGRDRNTDSHEISHCTSSDIRNKNYGKYPGKINAFYCLKDRAMILLEPRIRKSNAASYIPQEIREHRFKTYVTGQTAWDSEPLYIADELNCYCIGTECTMDDIEKGRGKGEWSDNALGPLEFIGYTAGMLMAVDKLDKDYWEREPKAIPFFKWQFTRAMNLFHLAKVVYPYLPPPNQLYFGKQDTVFDNLYKGESCKAMRDFLGEKIGYVVSDQPVSPEDDKLDKSMFKLVNRAKTIKEMLEKENEEGQA